MPKTVERALLREGRKKGYSGERLSKFVYGTMTNMAKRREIEWRRKKSKRRETSHEKPNPSFFRKRALGLALLLAVLVGGMAIGEVTPPTTIKSTTSLPGAFGKYQQYGIVPFCYECVGVPIDSDGNPDWQETRCWVPWLVRADGDTVGFQAQSVTVVVTKGDGCKVLPFGPEVGRGVNSWRVLVISTSADSISSVAFFPARVDSLWLWDESGTSRVCIFAY